MKSWSWVLLILCAIAIKWLSFYPDWVEKNYTYGVYPVISKFQRFVFGWIPFSVGDLFYAFLILVILVRSFQFLKLIFRKRMNRKYFIAGLQQLIFFFLFLYVIFNLLWGLNYNRKGLESQLRLEVKPYSFEELDTVAGILQERLNYYAALVEEKQRDSFDKKRALFRECSTAYNKAAQEYPFLHYTHPCIKPSLFSYAGNYLGFQGYYTPFSGEAQVNTTIPRFLEPYVTTHEIAHQLGYAKENEANFVGYLVCKSSASSILRYSMYFDIFNYAWGAIKQQDTMLAKKYRQQLHPQAVKDYEELREFYRKHRNPVEPVIMWVYNEYLKANNQPEGKQTYNAVIGWIVAYYKKYGKEAL
jgi:hypothetical protein